MGAGWCCRTGRSEPQAKWFSREVRREVCGRALVSFAGAGRRQHVCSCGPWAARKPRPCGASPRRAQSRQAWCSAGGSSARCSRSRRSRPAGRPAGSASRARTWAQCRCAASTPRGSMGCTMRRAPGARRRIRPTYTAFRDALAYWTAHPHPFTWRTPARRHDARAAWDAAASRVRPQYDPGRPTD